MRGSAVGAGTLLRQGALSIGQNPIGTPVSTPGLAAPTRGRARASRTTASQ